MSLTQFSRLERNHTFLRVVITGLLVSPALALLITDEPSPRASTVSASGTPHTASFSYWSEDDGFSSTVVLNNASDTQLTIAPTLYSTSGSPLRVSPIVLASRQQRFVNIADWLVEGSAGEDFKQGNLILSYEAPDAAYLGAQVTVANRASSLSFDFRNEMAAAFKSSRLEGLWWRPDGDSRYDLVLSNVEDREVSVTVRASGGQGRVGDFSFDVALMSHQTQIISFADKSLPFTTTEGAGKLGGISITHTSTPGGVLASGMLSKNDTGFSSHFTFEDPAASRSQVLAGSHLLTGKPDLPGFPDQSSFTSIALFRNASDSAIEVKPSVSFNSKGGPRTVSLPARMLAANQVEALNISKELKRSGIRGGVTGYGLTLTSNGQPGAIVAHVTGFDQTRNHAFDVPMKDPAIAMIRLSGSYPRSIDDDYQSMIHSQHN